MNPINLKKKYEIDNRVLNEIRNDMSIIPDWCDPRLIEHKTIWNIVEKIYIQISKLCIDKTIPTHKNLEIYQLISSLSDFIVEYNLDSNLNVEIYESIWCNIIKYNKIALDSELYYINHNLMVFIKWR